LLNDEARLLKKEAEQAYQNWVARDARLQNTILSSIDNALKPQVRGKTNAHDMYTVLRELNNDTEYANASEAWHNFETLRADQCNSSYRSGVSGTRITWRLASSTIAQMLNR
jgi:hypothetical protein